MSLPLASRLNNGVGVLSLLFGPHNHATAEGRALDRQRRIALSALASVLAKLISVSTALISVPLTLRYLGAERYGMWMTMSSLVAILGFADLGIGNGLLTSVAAAHGRNDRVEIRAHVSSAYFILTIIGIGVLGLFAICYPLVDWSGIFNVKTDIARREAAPAVAVLIACFALAIPLGVVQRVQMGLQQGFMASLWQCCASLAALAAVLVCIHLQAALPFLVLGLVGVPLLVGVLNSLLFFVRLQKDIAPQYKAVSRAVIVKVVKTGLLFLVLQITGALLLTSDNIILAQMLGPEAVAGYSIPEKLFSLISTTTAMALSPLWPAYSEAIARGDQSGCAEH